MVRSRLGCLDAGWQHAVISESARCRGYSLIGGLVLLMSSLSLSRPLQWRTPFVQLDCNLSEVL
eukprot:2011386-Amphidinium_carterae.1